MDVPITQTNGYFCDGKPPSLSFDHTFVLGKFAKIVCISFTKVNYSYGQVLLNISISLYAGYVCTY